MKINLRSRLLLLALLIAGGIQVSAQNAMDLIPTNTATHTAVQSGAWSDTTTWGGGTIPGDAAIVVIPSNTTVTYQEQSNAHIFAIRVDGTLICSQPNANQVTDLTFDTFVGTTNSVVKILAQAPTDGKVNVTIAPFDIVAHKGGYSGYPQAWNAAATTYYGDTLATDEVVKTVGPDDRFNSYALALAGSTAVTEVSRTPIDDGAGVLGRHGWDSLQLSLGMVLMGEAEIIGQPKTNMAKLSADALNNQASLQLASIPQGWQVGDSLVVTRGGNRGASSNGEDVVAIQAISGNTIICTNNLSNNHEGRLADTLHCYVGNLTRNITFRSAVADTLHQRGHFMAMHNPTNVQVRNATFKDMGRTDKSRMLDDFIWERWLQPKVFRSKISALGQEVAQLRRNPKAEITNTRGRYSIHLHRQGAQFGASMVHVTGNVVWGNPGWGITHHDAHANVSNNVVFDVVGAGIVSEAGNETGFWDNNLVVDVREGHTSSPYPAALFHEDYLYSGQGLGMKGRAVVCRGNVIANSKFGVGIMNMNPAVNNQERVDARALANVRPDYQFDQFPLSVNGYSSEGDGVMPVEVALIMENTTVISSNQGLRSIERDMGVNHESRSVFDGFTAWGVNQGLSITYQADYSFKDVFISGKNANSVGAFLWKHSHNHVFDGIKLVDLGYGVTVSKLVENNNSTLKTRNNGFTPWYFIDLQTVNVDTFYQIIKEDPSTTASYTEHGDNPIHLSSSEIKHRPTTFTLLDSTELAVDVGTGDLQFEIDGIITDDLGSYEMGIEQAPAQGTLRLSYPSRIYEFDTLPKFEAYLSQHGVYKDTANNDQLYFILNEWLPNRATYQYTRFPVRVNINNAPNSGIFATAQIEPSANFIPQNQIISRSAVVTQSSTDTTNIFGGVRINAGPEKAVDGNNNGRINVQFYQQGLLPVGSFSETEVESEPWYDLDLGENKIIDFIDLWNTVELNGHEIELNAPHFKDFYVLISDTAFGNQGLAAARALADYEYPMGSTPQRKFSLDSLNAMGRYIRIQASGMNKLAFAEVEVVGRKMCDQLLTGLDAHFVCDSLLWIDGNTYFTNNNTATHLLTSTEGCDSLVRLNLFVGGILVTAMQSGNDLVANLPNANSYQWLDCNNGQAPIPGATAQSFTPPIDGNYAVVVAQGLCSDTSDCVSYTFVGLETSQSDISLYPNPNSGAFVLDLSAWSYPADLTIFDSYGRAVWQQAQVAPEAVQLKLELPAGRYYLRLQSGEAMRVQAFTIR